MTIEITTVISEMSQRRLMEFDVAVMLLYNAGVILGDHPQFSRGGGKNPLEIVTLGRVQSCLVCHCESL